jgi:hypothetical protein
MAHDCADATVSEAATAWAFPAVGTQGARCGRWCVEHWRVRNNAPVPLPRGCERLRRACLIQPSRPCANLMVETGHFPWWPRTEILNPCISSSQTLSTVPAFPSVRTTALLISSVRACSNSPRIVVARTFAVGMGEPSQRCEPCPPPALRTVASMDNQGRRCACKNDDAYDGCRDKSQVNIRHEAHPLGWQRSDG